MEASTLHAAKEVPLSTMPHSGHHPDNADVPITTSAVPLSEPPQDLSHSLGHAPQRTRSAEPQLSLSSKVPQQHIVQDSTSATIPASSQQQAPTQSVHFPPPPPSDHPSAAPSLLAETGDPAAESTMQSHESLPFDKGYRPWNRGTKEIQPKMATRPTRPDAPVLWAAESNETYSTKDALTLQNATGDGQEDVNAVYGALRLPELLKPLKSREPTHAVPTLERIGLLLRNLAASMMQIIEEDNRHMWSIEQLQAILQGDDTFSEELALDATDKNMIKCKDVTQDFINVRKAYIEAISATRQRITHLIRTRQWLVAHLKEVERNDKHYLATKRDSALTKR